MPTLTVPESLNGPPGIAQGGYVCGAVAQFLTGAVEVTLRRPTPLGEPLQVELGEARVTIRNTAGEMVAEATPASIDMEVPPPVSLAEARRASERYAGHVYSPYPTCFVCGPEHPSSERVFPGPVDGRDVLATTWTPTRATAELVWAALDCPGGWVVVSFSTSNPLMGRMAAEIERLPEAGVEHVVVGWSMGVDGRKHHVGSALFTAEGEVLARARSTWLAATE